MADFDYRKFLKENKSTFFSSLTEGQFSWMTHDTDKQIGSEPQNTITVYMHDNEGNTWKEDNYEGYGEFGGMDYYELLDKMNGGEGDRSEGIRLAFDDTLKGKVLFPALTEDPRYPKGHDFTQEAKNDPDQSWYAPEEEEDDDELYEAQEGGLDVASIAQQVADEFTKSDELDLKYVVTPGSIEDTPAGPRRGAGFDLDVEAGPNTPGEDWKDANGFGIENYLGHFAGGSFTIKPEGDGYVVRNAAAKNAVVGYITPEGELDFVRDQEQHYDDVMSAEEKANVFVREAEGEVMVDAKLLASYIDAMLEYADEEYTPNILKSLEALKSKLSGKMSVKDALDFVQKTIDITGDDIDAIEALGQATDYDDAIIAQARKIMGIDENKKSNKMKKSELKEMIKAAMLAEYEKDVNVTDENPENEEDFLAEYDVEEGIFDRAKAKVAGAATAVKTAVKNVGAAVKGDKDAIKDTALQAGLAKMKVKFNSFDGDLANMLSDMKKLFPEDKLAKNPELKKFVDKYNSMLNAMKKVNLKFKDVENGQVPTLESLTETQNSEVLAMVDMIMDALGAEKFVDELISAMSTDEAKANLEHIIQMWDLDGGLYEAEGDEEEVDVEADAEETETDSEETTDVAVDSEETIDTETTAEINPDTKVVQDALTQAMEAAKKLGDKKLESQIGNTITFFTRAHIAGTELDAVAENTKEYYKDAEADDAEHIDALEKDMADDKKDSMKIGEVMFPMWTKLNK